VIKSKPILQSILLLSLVELLSSCHNTSSPSGSSVSAANVISPAVVDLDLTSSGPYQVVQSLYGRKMIDGKSKDLDAREDPLVLPGRVTDLRGAIWMPVPRSSGERYPLLVFLHGNHSTCREIKSDGNGNPPEESPLNDKGTCRESYEEVPSYLGYEYLAKKMASHGYVVVSINANRGINGWDLDFGTDMQLIEARGRLVLKQLAWLREWDSGARDSKSDIGLDLKGRVDFSHVGLMGHSRGGEAVRAAISLYQSKNPQSYAKVLGNVNFEGVFEFAPVDLYGSKPHDAPNVNWTVVIGSCDGDVIDYDGTGTFRRRRVREGMVGFSSIFILPGANHNFFNTEWTYSESESCGQNVKPLFDPKAKASAEQQRAALMTLTAFFRGFVTPNSDAKKYQQVFDPQYQLPKVLSQQILPTRESLNPKTVEKVALIQGRTIGTGVNITYYTEKFGQASLGSEDLTKAQRKVLHMTWKSPSPSTSVESSVWETPRDLRDKWILSLAMARYQKCTIKKYTKTCDAETGAPFDLSIALTMADGSTSSSVNLANYATLTDSLNEYLVIAECPTPFVFDTAQRRCTSKEILNKWTCMSFNGSWDSNKSCTLNTTEGFQRPLIFQEVPIELNDFRGARLDAIKGLRFIFDRSPGTHLLLDQTTVLRSISP
jgi:dienelactone hydrolase